MDGKEVTDLGRRWQTELEADEFDILVQKTMPSHERTQSTEKYNQQSSTETSSKTPFFRFIRSTIAVFLLPTKVLLLQISSSSKRKPFLPSIPEAFEPTSKDSLSVRRAGRKEGRTGGWWAGRHNVLWALQDQEGASSSIYCTAGHTKFSTRRRRKSKIRHLYSLPTVVIYTSPYIHTYI